MCGIVGYVGPRKAAPVLIEGLTKLEYRGYDSAGIAVIEGHRIVVKKAQGRLSKLEGIVAAAPPEGTVGIGHTRWATHGRPSDVNAHPHADCSGRFVAVHNGIIENYRSLQEWLRERGHELKSETDTEVIPHLVEEHYQGDLVEAVLKTIKQLHGSYATVIMSTEEPDRLVAARKDNPLVVGMGDGEIILASDIPAVLGITRSVFILEDGEVAVVDRSGVRFLRSDGTPVHKKPVEITWDAAMAEKGGYEHFMLKEIHEQPKAIRDTLTGRLAPEAGEVSFDGVSLTPEFINRIKKIFIVACGTASYAGLVGKVAIEKLTRIPVEVDLGSEFRYRDPIMDEDVLTIVISQSGETADTLAGLREAKSKGSRVVAITNVVGSSVAREADDVIYTWAGPEIAVASTKAYITQLVSLYMFALYLAKHRGTISRERFVQLSEELTLLPGKVERILSGYESSIKELAERIKAKEHVFFIGRGLDYCVSEEGSLKLKEISYIHAEAYPAGELKHGTLALVVEGVPVIALATQMSVYDKMVSNIREVKAREATVIAVARESNDDIHELADHIIRVPDADDLLMPVLTVVPLQLLAYYTAVARGCNVDKPRNLAKSVTVE